MKGGKGKVRKRQRKEGEGKGKKVFLGTFLSLSRYPVPVDLKVKVFALRQASRRLAHKIQTKVQRGEASATLTRLRPASLEL